MNSTYRISVKALIFSDDMSKVLLCKEENGKWDFPGGGLEYNETPVEALQRELLEEMGATDTDVDPLPLFFLTDSFEDSGKHFGNVFYRARLTNDTFKPSSECVEIRYVGQNEIGDIAAYPSVKKFYTLYPWR